VTDGIPPERQCPIRGDRSVNPHPDGLFSEHYPGDAPEITPLDKPSAGLSNRAPTLDEARAVTRTDELRDEGGFFEREHALLNHHEESQPEAREGDAEHTHADISKANELLGYEPTVDIREGTRKFIAWYRENQDWYDPLVRNS
jgi:hypothetical protein